VLQVLFAAVVHLDEGLKSWDITHIKGEKCLIYLLGTWSLTMSIIEQ
jgi:hypothetical protein